MVGQAPEAAVLVESVDDVADLPSGPQPMSYVVQGGLVIENAARVVAALRSRQPHNRGLTRTDSATRPPITRRPSVPLRPPVTCCSSCTGKEYPTAGS